jgi:hypothetical protein
MEPMAYGIVETKRSWNSSSFEAMKAERRWLG